MPPRQHTKKNLKITSEIAVARDRRAVNVGKVETKVRQSNLAKRKTTKPTRKIYFGSLHN
jgi:hypothetical protein